jgi:hypothetical protein
MDKRQRAGRDFLMRLIAQHGLAGAARVLRRRWRMSWTRWQARGPTGLRNSPATKGG